MENQSATEPNALRNYISEGTPERVIERYSTLAERAAESHYGEFDDDIVVIDTETTGLSFNHDELIQIAAARMCEGTITEWFVTFVNPGKPISDEISHLTGIGNEDVQDAPTPSEALASLVEFVGDSKVVAHNAEFDRTFTTRHPSGYPLLQNIWIDSLDLARIALPRLKSHRLIDIATAFGGPLSTHRADADVEATCVAFRILLAAVEVMPAELVAQIVQLADADTWPTQVVFEYFAKRSTLAEKSLPIGQGRESASSYGETHEASSSLGTFSLREMRRKGLRDEGFSASRPEHSATNNEGNECRFPDKSVLTEAFSDAGLVGSMYESFEPREQQVAMAQAIREAFEAEENLVIEAGTGVGKSMAYLVPLAYTSLLNNVVVGVATKTNALLDQLIYQELPRLSSALEQTTSGRKLTYAALKGYSHYPCLRKIERVLSEGSHEREVQGVVRTQAPAIAALLSYIEQTAYDDLHGLKMDYRLLPKSNITTTSRDCLKRKCPFYGHLCYVHGARRRAEEADIVVTNHSLLFCDIAADGGLLPPIKYWVIDEAHNAEDEARRALSVSLSADEILKTVRMVEEEGPSGSVFTRASKRVKQANGDDENQTLFFALLNKGSSAGEAYAVAAREFCTHLKDLLYFDTSKKGKGYEYIDLWINDDIRSSSHFAPLREAGQAMRATAEKLITACQELVGYLESCEGAAEVQRELAGLAITLKANAQAEEAIVEKAPDGFAYSATLNKRKDRANDVLEALMLNVGDALGETLYARTKSTVYTSATISVNNSFDPFCESMGLTASDQKSCGILQLDSCYDFDNNMIVYVVDDIPEPNMPGYMEALQKLLIETHIAQQGSMLTLFTNRREMEKCFDVVSPALKEHDLRLICQKWGVSVKGLRDDFLADEHLSLFALKSFWEGFDAPGATLKGVVIPKLPFSKPSDPLSCERAARDDQAWRRYVLPKAILETKQAAGRLIRKADDTGVLILADRRLLTKSYGKAFLNSLPSHTVKVRSTMQIAQALALLR